MKMNVIFEIFRLIFNFVCVWGCVRVGAGDCGGQRRTPAGVRVKSAEGPRTLTLGLCMCSCSYQSWVRSVK